MAINIEGGTVLSSVVEAVIVARQAQREGKSIPITPCVKVNEGGIVAICPKLDPKLNRLCTDSTGINHEGRTLVCPDQKGTLMLRR